MLTAIVLVTVARDRINEVAQQLSELEGVSEAYSVGGRYDVVALVRVPSADALAELVTNNLLKLEGIRDTETLIAFRTYSRHDLESMFEIGLGS